MSWNLLLYAIARDGTEHRAALDGVDDMRAALASDQCQVGIQLMERARTTRYWITSKDVRREVLPQVADASEQAALTAFLDDATRTLPVAPTALMLRAHATGLDHVHRYPRKRGGGLGGAVSEHARAGHPLIAPPAMPPERYGCRWGPDPNTGEFLTNVIMKRAIAASRRGSVDLLGLNACWMAALEIEYELRNVAAVEVASQVYARPWPYRAIVESLSRNPAQSADELGRSIVAAVRADIAADQRSDAVSAFRAGRAMEDLAGAFDMFARQVAPLVDSDWPAVREAVMTRVQRVDDPHQVDLVSLTRVLGQLDPAAKAAGEAVRVQFQSMRLGNIAHASHPGVNGLSIFCPKSTRVDLRDAYRGTEFRANHWATFLVKFQRALARAGASDLREVGAPN
jgi:hypothetical protein